MVIMIQRMYIKKCGRRVRQTRYATPASNDTGTAFCFSN